MSFSLPENTSKELSIAVDASIAAAEISKKYFNGSFEISIKEDMTPVTQVDVECEQAIKEILLSESPEHGFFGEETPQENKEADFLWLVDPIDGTKSFIRGYPFFSTQIALMYKGRIILGVSNGTMFNELIYAELNKGAWLNGERLNVSKSHNISSASISTGNLKSLAQSDGWQDLGKIISRADRIRGYGDFYHYHLLAAGKIDAVIESDVNILDIAALSIIIKEAGGVFTDLNGEQLTLDTLSVMAANSVLHAKLKNRLKGYVK